MNTRLDVRKSNVAAWIRPTVNAILVQPARFLGSIGVTPNTLTLCYFGANMLVAFLVANGQGQIGGWVMVLSTPLDLLDGAVARETGKETLFGGFLDSVLDQYGEVAILISILLGYLSAPKSIEVLLVPVAVFGAVMTSYVRARARSVGIDCREGAGMLTRFERSAICALGLIFNQVTIALWLLAVVSNLAAMQRIVHVWRAFQVQSSTLKNT